MNKLRAMELFVKLADLGSFTRVAEQLNTSKSLISKEITRLEEEIGARLLHRSTRKLQLTQVGEGYLQRCREILLKMNDADAYVQDLQQQPKGKLKINAPMALGITHLSRLFADFMRAYPQIELDIHLGDEAVDLIEQGFDVGFRAASELFDSNYIGRPLTRFRYHICASAEYLQNHGEINQAEDLSQHNCFIYSYFRGKNIWPLADGIHINGGLTVNSTIFMMEVIKQGQGIGFLPDFVCRPGLDSGELQEVLAEIPRPELTLYALYPERQFAPPKLIHCINFLEKWFQEKR